MVIKNLENKIKLVGIVCGLFLAGCIIISVASIVALKCLNLVPDLAAWMIPEGDTAFSTRNFGEGVAQQAKSTATGMLSGHII